MFTRLFTSLSVLVISLSCMGVAQQACKAVELPVGVISVTGDVFRGLAAEDFAAHIQKKPVSLKSLTYDEGPRRVLIVVDTNRKLSADTRKAEGIMVEALLGSARAEDTFALLPARGPGRDTDFTKDRRGLRAAIGGGGRKKEKNHGGTGGGVAGKEQ